MNVANRVDDLNGQSRAGRKHRNVFNRRWANLGRGKCQVERYWLCRFVPMAYVTIRCISIPVTALGGRAPHIGVGGFILSGGVSWLTHQHGKESSSSQYRLGVDVSLLIFQRDRQ